jgi:aerobic carbon-monoxide dehydrogenase medium subunit
MIPTEFDYHRVSTIEEAIGLLQTYGDDAKLIAGGHSLLPAMKLRLNRPAKLIDISRITGLKYIREEGNHLVIGAGSTHNDIASSALVKSKVPILAQAGAMIGDVQVRNWGTIGGSLAHADPAADWPASLMATEAEIVAQGKSGKRNIKVQDFFKGLFSTALQEGEIITEVRVPIPANGTVGTYLKFVQPASRFAIVGCAIQLVKNGSSISQARVAFTGVSENAFRDTAVENALQGKALDASLADSAAKLAAEGVTVLSDHFASEEYRKHLAKVYCKRALGSLV